MDQHPTTLYSPEFFSGQVEGSAASARAMLPVVLEVLRPLGVRSVADFGCGTGVWLAEFQRLGIADFLGIDGDYVTPQSLRIDASRFRAADLTKKIALERRFDLALSLEVGEHLPAAAADAFVDNLCAAADAILFSACPPTPRHGTGHINEQTQGYWAEKFSRHGFVASTSVRDRIWQRREIEWFYRQNVVLYLTPEAARRCGLDGPCSALDVRHPEFAAMLIAESVHMHSGPALLRVLGRRLKEKMRRVFKA